MSRNVYENNWDVESDFSKSKRTPKANGHNYN